MSKLTVRKTQEKRWRGNGFGHTSPEYAVFQGDYVVATIEQLNGYWNVFFTDSSLPRGFSRYFAEARKYALSTLS